MNELVTNALDHAYPDGVLGAVWLWSSVDTTGTLHASVTDRGRWSGDAGPLSVDDLSAIPQRLERGRGLSMTQRLVDTLDLERRGHGTTARITHRLSRPARLLTVDGLRGARAPTSARDTRAEFLMILDEPSSRGLRIRLAGPVDGGTAAKLRAELARRTRGGGDPLTVDLSGVTLLASAGVAVLGAADAEGTGGTLRLYAPAGSEADQVLTLVGLDHATTEPDPYRPVGHGGAAHGTWRP